MNFGKTSARRRISVLRRHDLKRKEPAASPWHGLLLGNGDMGAVVFGPEHALRFRLNKLDLWDSRWPEGTKIDALPLSKFKRVAMEESLRLADGERIKRFDQLPCSKAVVPYPCMRTGADLVLGVSPFTSFNSPNQSLRLRDATFKCTWNFSHWVSHSIVSEAFVCRNRNVLALRLSAGAEAAAGFLSLALRRDPLGGRDDDMLRHGEWGTRNWRNPRSGMLPEPVYRCDQQLAVLMQTIPGDEHSDPCVYAVAAYCDGGPGFISGAGGEPVINHVFDDQLSAYCYVAIATDRECSDPVGHAVKLAEQAARDGYGQLHREHKVAWKKFWSASNVELADKNLERIWYRESYRMACHVRPDGPAPALFGVGVPYDCPPWRGDRHNNWPEYASLFWGAFSSNHTDLVLNYIRNIESFLPEARKLAREIFECDRGAAFPHVYFDYSRRIYFDNLWARSLYLTAITAQNCWWHYQYTRDSAFLEEHGYPVICDAADFYVALVEKNPPDDYSLGPTVPPEYRGFLKDLALSRNCIFDIAMVKFILRAAINAADLLCRDSDRKLQWQHLLEHLPGYPTLEQDGLTLFADVEGNTQIPPYNHPVGVAPLFPGEDSDCFNNKKLREIAENTLRSRNWSDYQQVAYARLGDTEKAYKLAGGGKPVKHREDANITYASGVKIIQSVNELLLSSWDNVIRVFPAWPRQIAAQFERLRAVGAFLVSSSCADGVIGAITIVSEAGAHAVVQLPWPDAVVEDIPDAVIKDGCLCFETQKGASYQIRPPVP